MNLLSQAAAALAAAVAFLTGGVAAPSPLSIFDIAAQPATLPRATVLFGGDMMFDRTVRTTAEKNGADFLFFCIDPTLLEADAVVANLEGPITGNTSRSVGSAVGAANNFVFTFPLASAKLLFDHHIRIVNTGNNHILNFGFAGLASTQQALSDAGVAYFGQAAGESYVYRTTIGGVPLEFVNYNQFGGNASTTIMEIERARADGFLPVVYTHWGIEYATVAPQFVRDLAHRFVDAGAAAVIGSHPHVVEDHESYNGAPIYYSLGNFIFDQYFSDAVDHGLLLELTFDTNGVQAAKEIPITLGKDRTVCPSKVQ